jgi:hypothetical protein
MTIMICGVRIIQSDRSERPIQDLLDELESSKQSRLRAWNVLRRLRSVLSDLGDGAIPLPTQKTFDAEGEALKHALTKSFRIRNEAIKSLCSSVRRFRDATIQGRVQMRLSVVESPRSGRRADSELLRHVRSIPTNHGRGRTNPEKH